MRTNLEKVDSPNQYETACNCCLVLNKQKSTPSQILHWKTNSDDSDESTIDLNSSPNETKKRKWQEEQNNPHDQKSSILLATIIAITKTDYNLLLQLRCSKKQKQGRKIAPAIARSPGKKSPFVPYYRHIFTSHYGKKAR